MERSIRAWLTAHEMPLDAHFTFFMGWVRQNEMSALDGIVWC